MKMIISCHTDAGTTKKINQDAVSARLVDSFWGEIAFAVVCDGVGGLDFGEQASRETVLAFHNWFAKGFSELLDNNMVTADMLFGQWQRIIDSVNGRLRKFAGKQGKRMGTTVSALLIWNGKYYICHVGDSRIYRIDQSLQRLTTDHTLVEQEIATGMLTREQAESDARRNILLQCIGASQTVTPQFTWGQVRGDTTFVLSTDGLVHLLTEEELYEYFRPERNSTKEQLTGLCRETVNLVMSRGERDNITVAALALREAAG